MNGAGNNKFYGKYRGTVVSNIDPMQEGRLLVQVPDVVGPHTVWAVSASPLAGPGMGMYVVPPVGAGVWIELEQGDPDYPIWTGCWRGTAADVPPTAKAAPPGVPPIVISTTGQNSLVISDAPGPAGGILIKCRSGAFISVTDLGITISNGKGATISMVSGTNVDINNGALTVLF